MKRKTLYSVLEGDANSRPTVIYDRFMTFVILLSLLPLCFKESNLVLDIIDYVTVSIFMIDYALRWSTADMKLGHGRLSFLIYPFTPMALIDMLSILPSFLAINPSWRLSRLVRLIRVVRAFKLLRYSRSLKMIVKVFIDEREPLLAVLLLAIAYTFVSALIVFNVEPETFPSLFDAVYWAVISLTTVGYGDIYPQTEIGRAIAMISSVMGIAIIALPSGIITASFMEELQVLKVRPDDSAEAECANNPNEETPQQAVDAQDGPQ